MQTSTNSGDRQSPKRAPQTPAVQTIDVTGQTVHPKVTGLSPAYDAEAAVLRAYVERHEPDRAVILINTQKVVDQWHRWRLNLPRVSPFYAVKCNSDLGIVKTLADLGACFDCASPSEIDLVLRGVQIDPKRIIYSNPCKQIYGIRHAKECNVSLTVFDNWDELVKIAEIYPEAHLLLRIATNDATSQCPLSCKFGAPPSSWRSLLEKASDLGLCLRGVHFHVGSGCSQLGAFTQAIRDARRVFDLAASYGHKMDILNIGGGFPGSVPADTLNNSESRSVTFEALCGEIRDSLKESFPEEDNLSIYAEPGRFFAAPSCTLAVKVFARRFPVISGDFPNVLNDGGVGQQNLIYYINDGLYGCFNNLVFDHATVTPRILLTRSMNSLGNRARAMSTGSDHVQLFESAVFGQTCDGFDCVEKRVMLPLLDIGDWLIFEEMGAYTISAASTFNGFEIPLAVHVRLITTAQSADTTPPPLPTARGKQKLSPCLAGYYQYKQRQQQALQQALPAFRAPQRRGPVAKKYANFPFGRSQVMPGMCDNKVSSIAIPAVVDLPSETEPSADLPWNSSSKMTGAGLDAKVLTDFKSEASNEEGTVVKGDAPIANFDDEALAIDTKAVEGRATTFGKPMPRPRLSVRPVSVRALQSTAQQSTSFARVGGGKVNAKMLANLLRTAYCRNRPIMGGPVERSLSIVSDGSFDVPVPPAC